MPGTKVYFRVSPTLSYLTRVYGTIPGESCNGEHLLITVLGVPVTVLEFSERFLGSSDAPYIPLHTPHAPSISLVFVLTCRCMHAAPSRDNASPLPLSATASSMTKQGDGRATETQLLEGGFSPLNHLSERGNSLSYHARWCLISWRGVGVREIGDGDWCLRTGDWMLLYKRGELMVESFFFSRLGTWCRYVFFYQLAVGLFACFF